MSIGDIYNSSEQIYKLFLFGIVRQLHSDSYLKAF